MRAETMLHKRKPHTGTLCISTLRVTAPVAGTVPESLHRGPGHCEAIQTLPLKHAYCLKLASDTTSGSCFIKTYFVQNCTPLLHSPSQETKFFQMLYFIKML